MSVERKMNLENVLKDIYQVIQKYNFDEPFVYVVTMIEVPDHMGACNDYAYKLFKCDASAYKFAVLFNLQHCRQPCSIDLKIKKESSNEQSKRTWNEKWTRKRQEWNIMVEKLLTCKTWEEAYYMMEHYELFYRVADVKKYKIITDETSCMVDEIEINDIVKKFSELGPKDFEV